MWAAQGHKVKFVSCTNGDIGHWGMAGGPLADLSSLEETVVSPPFDFDDPTMPRFGDELPVDETATVAATARSGPERPFLGMTAQQRAVLALFLFLDVLVIGFLILLGTGSISIPVP